MFDRLKRHQFDFGRENFPEADGKCGSGAVDVGQGERALICWLYGKCGDNPAPPAGIVSQRSGQEDGGLVPPCCRIHIRMAAIRRP
jgi:hypothetical protein